MLFSQTQPLIKNRQQDPNFEKLHGYLVTTYRVVRTVRNTIGILSYIFKFAMRLTQNNTNTSKCNQSALS